MRESKPCGPGCEEAVRLHHRGDHLVQRQRLAPGEATPWHRDPFHRAAVVLSGDLLSIEFRDGGETQTWKIAAGEVDWVEPSHPVHRAVNVGNEVFEEVATLFLDRPERYAPAGGRLRVAAPST
jgi:quercetin dioxygenase-like cupin family protein